MKRLLVNEQMILSTVKGVLGLNNRQLAAELEISEVYMSRTLGGHHPLSKKTAKRLRRLILSFLRSQEEGPEWFEDLTEALNSMARHLNTIDRRQGK